MSHFIRDTSFGRLARFITRNRVLRFPEEQDDFQLQDSYVKLLKAAELRSKDKPLSIVSQSEGNNDTYSNRPSGSALPDDEGPAKVDEETQQDDMFEPKMLEDGTIVVNWYGPHDPANPQNWTSGQKLVPTLIIDAYTFAVYLGSSIITGSYTGIMCQPEKYPCELLVSIDRSFANGVRSDDMCPTFNTIQQIPVVSLQN
jgi:DHA1 family multidrug resistance protein-like MFS transporter